MFDTSKEFEIVRRGTETTLKINSFKQENFPAIEDDGKVMEYACRKILQTPSITKIVFSHNKNYEYDLKQIHILSEISEAYRKISQDKILFSTKDIKIKDDTSFKIFFDRYHNIQKIILKKFLSDPIGAYVKLKREYRKCIFEKEHKELNEEEKEIEEKYEKTLEKLLQKLEKITIIKKVKNKVQGHEIGSRKIYHEFFSPNVKPNFIFTSLQKQIPYDAQEIDSYILDSAKITIFKLEKEAITLYHMMPLEFSLNEAKYNILSLAKEVLADHKPESNDFIEPKRLREVFSNISRDLITEIAEFKKVDLTPDDIEMLTKILVKYTIGFGMVETLLEDEAIQDISINSPANKSKIFITHDIYGDCKTNIIPEFDEIEGYASRLRMISGKPFDATNPILDTEIETEYARARVSAVGKPLNPYGIGFSFRRHRDKPWTLPLFIKNKMITAEVAGVLSFIIDGARTMLIAGTRGSGKSSFLTALMIEILRQYRIITIEDTLEIPTLQFSELGYNIQSLAVRSALSLNKDGFSADMGIRSTLRLGDSCLIVGEVRSTEAIALYEAMRVGALANVVAGTIHGDSPHGVYDRLVNDLGVPKTSFKATDLIIIANPVKSSDGLSRKRRVTRITEVRKFWEEDPLMEEGFCDLFVYNSRTDTLEITNELKNGECDLIKNIGGNIKQWAGNWEAIWDNIMLRAKIKKFQADLSIKYKTNEILEAKYVIESNDMFHKISEEVNEEFGNLDSKKIYSRFVSWYEDYIKKVVKK